MGGRRARGCDDPAEASLAQPDAPRPPHTTLLRCVRAEILKLRGSRMIPLHLAIALGIPLVFVAYYVVSDAFDQGTKISVFLQVVACGMTFVAGLVAGLAIEDEWAATRLQAVLGVPSRTKAAAAKLLVYLGFALACLALALGAFAVGMGLIGQPVWTEPAPVAAAGLTPLVSQFALIFLGSVPCYVLAFWVSLTFGRNAGFGLGILGLLVALLMLTGMGDGIWPYVPWAWPGRLAVMLPDALQIAGGGLPDSLATLESQTASMGAACYLGFYRLGFGMCLGTIVVLVVVAGVWVARTDGRRGE